VTESTFRLSPTTYVEADFIFHNPDVPLTDLNGENIPFVVELADSSLYYDLGDKAEIYAGVGIREFWVINAVKLETHIHLCPRRGSYQHVQVFQKDQAL